MRLFISEFVSGGAWPAGLHDNSLAREGKSMLTAILADFARIADCHLVTTWDARLGRFNVDRVRAIIISDPAEELRLFRQLAAECDATFVIAPECDGILAERRRLVDAAGGMFLGPSLETIELCTDKLRLAEHLLRNGIPTIETAPLESAAMGLPPTLPIVVKPRDGAGSQQTFLVADRRQIKMVDESFRNQPGGGEAIWQPYVPGRAISVGVVISHGGDRMAVFPPAEQHLSDDGRFRYRGGRISVARESRKPKGESRKPKADLFRFRLSAFRFAIESLIRRACRSLPAPNGYLGFDLVLPIDAPGDPVIVEINPRLTTSYLGYRAICVDNLAARILAPEIAAPEIAWKPQNVVFRPDGHVEMTNSE